MTNPEAPHPLTGKAEKHRIAFLKSKILSNKTIIKPKPNDKIKNIINLIKNKKNKYEFLKNNGYVLYHITSNPNLKTFINLNEMQKTFSEKIKRRDYLQDKIKKYGIFSLSFQFSS